MTTQIPVGPRDQQPSLVPNLQTGFDVWDWLKPVLLLCSPGLSLQGYHCFPVLQEEMLRPMAGPRSLTCMTQVHSEALGEGGPAVCLASSAAALVGGRQG